MTFKFRRGRNLDWSYLFECYKQKKNNNNFNTLRLQKAIKRLNVKREDKRREGEFWRGRKGRGAEETERRDIKLRPGALLCQPRLERGN